MDLSNLKPAKGSTHSKKRLGRGEGSGYGDTAGRGHKGAKSRSGYSSKRGFEGGQMPLQRRVPKFGFTPINKTEYKTINLDVLQRLVSEKGVSEFSHEVFIEQGLCSKRDVVKILGRGELSAKVKVSAHAFSATAKAAIESKGGEAVLL
jgi:large subunit ribosomal protein L15